MAFVPCNLPDDNDTPLAFVAGATGYVGREVVYTLRQKDIITVAHVRPNSSQLSQWKNRFSKIRANLDVTPWDEKAMTKRLSQIKPTHIFCLIGTTRNRMKTEGESYMSIDYGLTALLINAAKSAKIKPRFIYLSSAGTLMSPYLKARLRAEEAVKKSDLPYIIARPAIITGDNRDDPRVGEVIAAKLIDQSLKVAGFLGARKLKERYTSTSNKVLANNLVRLALNRKIKNQIVESEDLRK